MTLEINTVEKPGMSAQKMPILPIALHQIAEEYDRYLYDLKYAVTRRLLTLCAEHLVDLRKKVVGQPVDESKLRNWLPGEEPVDRADLMIDRRSFDALRWAAEACLRDSRTLGLRPETEAILVRIRSNCRQLGLAVTALETRWKGQPAAALLGGTIDDIRKTLLDKPEMVVPVDSDVLTLVRKMWDLGTAQVLMQTSIQVDGDAANFLSPNLTDGQHGFALQAHRRVVEIALAQWKSLFQLAVSLAGDIGKAL